MTKEHRKAEDLVEVDLKRTEVTQEEDARTTEVALSLADGAKMIEAALSRVDRAKTGQGQSLGQAHAINADGLTTKQTTQIVEQRMQDARDATRLDTSKWCADQVLEELCTLQQLQLQAL